MLSVIVFLIIISALVLIHEFGHFIAARWVGIRVEEFALGLPFTKSLWSKKLKGVLVSIYPILFGGFVKLTGEESLDKDSHDPKSFANKPVSKRLIVVLAGVGLNLLAGILLYTIALGFKGWKAELAMPIEHNFAGASVSKESIVLVGNVAEGSPASQAGIVAPVAILTLDGQKVDSVKFLQDYIKPRASKEVEVGVRDLRNGDVRRIKITPRAETPAGEGRLGVAIDEFTTATLNYSGFPRVLFSGVYHSYNMIAYSLKYTGKVFAQALATKDIRPVSQSFAGPVGVGLFVSDVLKTGNQAILNLIELTALLSLNLAILNVLPIPALDGGRLVFLGLEALAGRRIVPKLEIWTQRIGMMLILGLIILITYNDLLRLIESSTIAQQFRRFLPQ